MINNPGWHKTKIKPYFHQLSLGCIEEIAEYIESNDIEKMDCNTCLIMQEILNDEIDRPEFLEFAIENFSETVWYRERQAQIKRQATTMIRIARKKYLITVIFFYHSNILLIALL